MSNKISIIIPCYNCEKFVFRAIESVFLQTYTDWELILVDNNSTDDSYKILNEFKEKLPGKIKVLRELKKGAPAARNRGFMEATGEWIQFLDADDEILPEKLKIQLDLANTENADIVCGSYIKQEKLNLGKGIKAIYNSIRRNIIGGNRIVNDDYVYTFKDPNINTWEGLISTSLGITSANLWRSTKIKEVNGWNEQLTSSQEYDLIFRILKQNGNIALDYKRNTIVHQIENSISRSLDKEKITKILDNWLELRLRIKEYLLLSNQMTPELSSYLDIHFYKVLMDHKLIIPKYINNRMRLISPKVPFYFRLKKHLKFILKLAESKVLFG